MESFLFYILKSGICLTVFYICFKAFLSNDTFFRLNRFVLLGGIIACLLLPLIQIEVKEKTALQQPVQKIEEMIWGITPEPTGTETEVAYTEADYLSYPDEILMHEEQHLIRKHSADLMFLEAVILLHWFNPAVWLLKKELQDIHEYQADLGVLTKGIDAKKYQLLLVKKAVGSSSYALANSFNHSKIKKRITMMLKDQSNKWARLKPLLLVPLGFIALQAFARPIIPQEVTKPLKTEVAITFTENKDNTIAPIEQKKEEKALEISFTPNQPIPISFEPDGDQDKKKNIPPPPPAPPGKRTVMEVIFYYGSQDDYKAFNLQENSVQKDVDEKVKKWWNEKVTKIRIRTVAGLTEEKLKELTDMLSKATPRENREIDCIISKGSLKE